MQNGRTIRLLTPPPNTLIVLPHPLPEALGVSAGVNRRAPDGVTGISPQKKRRLRLHPGNPTVNSSNQRGQQSQSIAPNIVVEAPHTIEALDTADAVDPGIEFDIDNTSNVDDSTPATALESNRIPFSDNYEWFSEAVVVEAIPFLQLADDLYVVTGWDPRQGKRTNHWYHLQVDYSGSIPKPVCFCPSGREQGTCVHQRYLIDEGSLHTFNPKNDAQAIVLFWRDAVEEGWINHFSVGVEVNHSLAKQRVVVTYVGSDSGFGDWKCSRDGRVHCTHITRAQAYLQQMVTGDPMAVGVDHQHVLQSSPDHIPNGSCTQTKLQSSVSYLPIMAPDWARIPSDRILYTDPPPVDRVPDLLTLGQEAQCRCGTLALPEGEVFQRPCTVYTFVRPISTHIQLQKCPRCNSVRYPSRAIGPDCRRLGIFNYNNIFLFSLDLLEDYTSSYTSTEMPFSAWIKIVGRRYQRWSESSFVDESVFRAVWFRYIDLLDLSNDMVCPHCGPTPETVIWDGITLAYHKKQILETIYPPTTKHVDATIRPYGYPKHQSFIDDLKLRKLLSSVSEGPVFLNADITCSMDAVDIAIQKLRDLDDVFKLISEKCAGLQVLLMEYYGPSRCIKDGDPPHEVRRFFSQISTHESVTQVVNRPALKLLEKFLDEPCLDSHASLACMPCLYRLGRYQWTTHGFFSRGLIQAFTWVRNRVRDVFNSSILYETPPCIEDNTVIDGGWKKSGCKYVMPQIRHRPQYPKMAQDISKESKDRGGLCNKYYSEYGENKLTGGIMVAWCTHSICFGFHFIPESEGRNDVFSAMVTRWPVAPKYVIYDFACQLAPYCRAREPEFFADTTFLVDDFHAMGHSKCSPAFFLKTYAETQPSLGRINSSAAECGNGGLSKIRKSVRYMGQDRAILYTAVFLSMWNRLKIRRMLHKSDIVT